VSFRTVIDRVRRCKHISAAVYTLLLVFGNVMFVMLLVISGISAVQNILNICSIQNCHLYCVHIFPIYFGFAVYLSAHLSLCCLADGVFVFSSLINFVFFSFLM